MKKIGIVGYYGHGNFGDDLFLLAFRRLFASKDYRLDLLGHSGALMRKYKDSRLVAIKDNYSAIIIGGGDILIPGYDVSNQYLLEEFLQVPIFIHGVGVPAWTGFDKQAFERLKVYLKNDAIRAIAARDKESVDWINTKVSPKTPAVLTEDIVWSLADILDPRVERSGEAGCVGIVMRGGQNKPGCKMKDFVAHLLGKGLRVRFIMLATGKELDFDLGAVEKLECVDSPLVDVVVRQSDGDLLNAFGGVDVVYSMKFHGCIAALMNGIPTVALITTDKFNHLYKKLGIEKFIIHHTNAKLFDSLESFREFPRLDIDQLYRSSSESLAKLKDAVDAVA